MLFRSFNFYINFSCRPGATERGWESPFRSCVLEQLGSRGRHPDRVSVLAEYALPPLLFALILLQPKQFHFGIVSLPRWAVSVASGAGRVLSSVHQADGCVTELAAALRRLKTEMSQPVPADHAKVEKTPPLTSGRPGPPSAGPPSLPHGLATSFFPGTPSLGLPHLHSPKLGTCVWLPRLLPTPPFAYLETH